jgi:hypothetical protein
MSVPRKREYVGAAWRVVLDDGAPVVEGRKAPPEVVVEDDAKDEVVADAGEEIEI